MKQDRHSAGRPAQTRQKRSEKGVILFIVLTITLIAGIIVSSMLATAHTAIRSVRKWRDDDECMLLAQSAMEKAKWDLYEAFRSYFDSPPLARTTLKFPWFDRYSDTWIGRTNPYRAPQEEDFEGGNIWVTIADVQTVSNECRAVLLKVRAEKNGMTRRITELVRYELAPSHIFDYAYFINNFGWFWGSSIYAHGEVRSNGNFSFQYGPKVNGDAYAAVNPDLNADGTISGSWNNWSLSDYYSRASNRQRPGNPPFSGYEGEWPMGYDGDPDRYQRVDRLEMPYLGDLSDYIYLANLLNGHIRQGNTTIVDKVYDGNGPDGVAGTPDDGTLVLVGTNAHPISIDGPVVVTGDVIIKGKVTGQGTIYAGRNIYIVGNIEYVDPPSWPHPDSNPENTARRNRTKDLLGLAAKGNIILGNYLSSDWQSKVTRYIRPNFTQPYDVDASDADLGYDSDRNPANGYRFNGDYTAYDGGQKIDQSGHVKSRRFYECSNEQAYASVSPTNNVSQVDAVCYTNHLFGGRVSSCKFNGVIASRDEGIIFNNYVQMNWDIRVGSRSMDAVGVDIYLPRTLRQPRTVLWREF